MIAGPPQQFGACDSPERETSPLLRKIQSGKMETRANTAGNVDSGFLMPEEMVRAFHAGFLDERACRHWILKKLHPKGPLCPVCGQDMQSRCLKRYWENRRIQCHQCGKWFTALTGTIFQRTKMDFSEIMLLALFLGMDQPPKTIAGFLNEDEKTIRIWRHRFEQARVLMNR